MGITLLNQVPTAVQSYLASDRDRSGGGCHNKTAIWQAISIEEKKDVTTCLGISQRYWLFGDITLHDLELEGSYSGLVMNRMNSQ